LDIVTFCNVFQRLFQFFNLKSRKLGVIRKNKTFLYTSNLVSANSLIKFPGQTRTLVNDRLRR
jgi:hypothetical protein